MTVTRISVSQDERRAAELRGAVERLESSELSISSVADLCRTVIDVADRLAPVRIVRDDALLFDVERAAPGAHRILTAVKGMEEAADRG